MLNEITTRSLKSKARFVNMTQLELKGKSKEGKIKRQIIEDIFGTLNTDPIDQQVYVIIINILNE